MGRPGPPPVFRFAPSPNGRLHLGHAFSALLNDRLARRNEGRFLLRIEDIDPVRSRPELVQAIFDDLAWLGLSWETPVLRQSAHLADYAASLAVLERRGLLYPCFCSRGDTARFVAEREQAGIPWPRDPDGAPYHAGPCRLLSREAADARISAGEPHALRLAMDLALDAAGPVPAIRSWDPETGEVAALPADPARWGDPVLARRDVRASYHLCVVHDDARQGVTHVVRGEDLREATHLHALLQDLLGLPAPLYHHHGLVADEEGRKLAKSRGSETLADLRQAGIEAADVIRRLGFDPDDMLRIPPGVPS
jgi:glutamyl-Q tRNA(Asp) synthetase